MSGQFNFGNGSGRLPSQPHVSRAFQCDGRIFPILFERREGDEVSEAYLEWVGSELVRGGDMTRETAIAHAKDNFTVRPGVSMGEEPLSIALEMTQLKAKIVVKRDLSIEVDPMISITPAAREFLADLASVLIEKERLA